MITGANSGLGKETAIGLAKLGANLVLVCRTKEKGEAAKAEVLRATGSNSIELMTAELSLMKEVRRIAGEYAGSRDKLDVLVNNAGSNFPSYAETEEGIERTMAVNYFAPFLLTNLLLGPLKTAVPSRVVNVSSSAHYSGQLNLEKVNDRRMGLGGLSAYGRSKLALVLFSYELARRLQGTGVTVNCLHPGAVRTNIWSHAGVFSPLARLGSLFMMSAKIGAETQVYLASSSEVEGVSGKYFEQKEQKRSSSSSYDERLAAGLWELSARMTGIADPIRVAPR